VNFSSCDSIVSEDVVEKQNLKKKNPEKEAQQLKELKVLKFFKKF
jgi:hypothetical protein